MTAGSSSKPRVCLWPIVWPGLTRLWHQGRPLGLVWALLAGLLLNSTLISWLIWLEWLASPIPHILVSVTLLCWIGGLIDGIRATREMANQEREDPHLDLFLSARMEYLRGHWEESERLLVRLLETSPEDVEARLLRATLLRHRGRAADARDQLRRLQRWNRASLWNQEIRREWDRLSRPAIQTARHVPVGPLLPARAQRGSQATSAHLVDFPTSSEPLKDVA